MMRSIMWVGRSSEGQQDLIGCTENLREGQKQVDVGNA